MTHLAPELLQAGTKITTAVDNYAFGIMLWCAAGPGPAYREGRASPAEAPCWGARACRPGHRAPCLAVPGMATSTNR